MKNSQCFRDVSVRVSAVWHAAVCTVDFIIQLFALRTARS